MTIAAIAQTENN